jgi:hypothetical protein
MATKRTQTVALGALIIVLAGVLWYELRTPAVPPAAASNEQNARTAPGNAQQTASNAVAGVKLEDLLAPRPAPNDADRNPFQFKPKPAPPPPPIARPPVVTTTTSVAPMVPPGPPPPPAIRVKFIGVVEQEGKGKIAVLSDAGNVFYGTEGKIADGRFLIIRIGVESIEMSYPDGRGRTTIRLSGS